MLRDRLASHESYYPSIRRWITDKVLPDLKTGRRVGYIGFQGEAPVLAAILKQGVRTKFCHLSIDSGFQGSRLGHLMFSLMAAEVRGMATEVHFTLPESLWVRERGFFQTFGFESAVAASNQYRLFEEELSCSAPFSRIWQRVLQQIPKLLTSQAIAGFQVNDGVVLSVHESHARAIMLGRKTVELRRRFAERWIGRCASVYAAGGSGCLLGTVMIDDVVKASPKEIWDHYSDNICCTKAEFDVYAADRPHLYALRLCQPRPYQAPVPLSQLSFLLGERIRPPQSYAMHSTTDVWSRALSIAALLHRTSSVSRAAV
jgi:predicted transcriptional regulator